MYDRSERVRIARLGRNPVTVVHECEKLGHRALVVDLANNCKDDVASLEFQTFFEYCI